MPRRTEEISFKCKYYAISPSFHPDALSACEYKCRYIETDPSVDLKDLGPGSIYRSSARVGEWEGLMDSFFEKGGWTLMDPVYTLTSYSSSNTEAPNYATK